ncbi:MAG: GNAT family N-acetyltransferase [Armatimonadetes bacterium]|nr:GNAT family N-acetyltransferase [Armatimonadota bacterium]
MAIEYADSLHFDLCFQGFDEEIAGLPGAYAPPSGAMLVALWESEAAGCVAMKPLGEGECEMKRLFVRRAYRGQGIGRALADQIIDAAKYAGYGLIRLDTLSTMAEARSLYRSLGFEVCAPYTFNPLAEAVYMEKVL